MKSNYYFPMQYKLITAGCTRVVSRAGLPQAEIQRACPRDCSSVMESILAGRAQLITSTL